MRLLGTRNILAPHNLAQPKWLKSFLKNKYPLHSNGHYRLQVFFSDHLICCSGVNDECRLLSHDIL
jgi:hypothetical protein